MRILCDTHHACLYESHQLVFGDRFGWDVYTPYGMDWFDSWYWSFEREHHGDAVARQYLEGIFAGGVETDGIIEVADRKHPGRTIHGVTLERALSERWDVALSSVPANAAGFRQFASDTRARWGIHVGNQWGDEAWRDRPEFAILTTTSVVPPGIPHVVVHQEFSLNDFRYEAPLIVQTDNMLSRTGPVYFGPARSFVSCFPENTDPCQHGSVVHPTGEYGAFVDLAKAAPEIGWEVFGAYGSAPLDEYAAGNLSSDPEEGDAMRGAGIIWHGKHWSDGFGHVVHRAFAVGRPVFGYAGYYADKLAGPLWIDGLTSIDVGSRSRQEVITELRSLRGDPDRYLRMCEASAARFRELVSFDEDADKIAGLLGVAVPA